MIEFFQSTYFLGILFMALSCILFLTVFFLSWYTNHPHRFWITRLTYVNDKEQQSFVRLTWLLAWLVAFIGSLITAYNHPEIPHTFWWILGQTVYGVILVWLLAKAILLLCILLQYICSGFIWLKDWICNDKSLFNKTNL